MIASRLDGIIVGPLSHPIVPLLAADLRDRGLQIAAMNGTSSTDSEYVGDVPLIAARPLVAEERLDQIDRWATRAGRIDRELIRPRDTRRLQAFESEFGSVSRSEVETPVRRGAVIAAAVEALQPRFVFVNHMFQYGWVAATVNGPACIAMPWGGDIYNIGLASRAAQWIVGQGLRRADVVVPSAASSVEILRSIYRVNRENIVPTSWGVDLDGLPRLTPERRRALRARLELPVEGQVIFNCRRLKSAWGADEALLAMIDIARRRPETHHVILAGGDNADLAAATSAAVAEHGLSTQFRIIADDVSMETFIEYCGAADVALSLRTTPDMRSLSILQCAASGASVVSTDQPEYRAMNAQGFRCRYVSDLATASIVHEVEGALATTPEEIRVMAAANRLFVETHEDRSMQLEKLAATIEQACDAKGRLRLGSERQPGAASVSEDGSVP